MGNCITDKTILRITSSVVTLFAFCRAFRFNYYMYIMAFVFLIFVFVFIQKKLELMLLDFFILVIPIIMLFDKNSSYPLAYCMYFLVGWFSYYVFRNEIPIQQTMLIIRFFSIFNVIFNLLNLYLPNIYFNIVKYIFTSSSFETAKYYYYNYGFISGLADHYSRNAYFCVAGALVFAAYILAGEKHNKTLNIVGLCINIVMIMIIGKRGHLIFLIVALAYTYLLTTQGISNKMINFIKIIIIGGIIFGVLIEMIPDVSNVFERFISQKHNGDISTGRFELWAEAWRLFKKKPLLGWGYGYFNTHIKNENLNVFFAGVHNDYLQWLCEQGVIGFLFNCIPMLVLFALSVKELKFMADKQNDVNLNDKVMIIWSVLFQVFVILYSLTGLPHVDFEINTIYYISICVPYMMLSKYSFNNIKRKRLIIKRS